MERVESVCLWCVRLCVRDEGERGAGSLMIRRVVGRLWGVWVGRGHGAAHGCFCGVLRERDEDWGRNTEVRGGRERAFRATKNTHITDAH